MMADLTLHRRFYADEVQAVSNLRAERLVEAFAVVPREAYLRPGPWMIGDFFGGPHQTIDADPRRVYHNVSVAIDPARQLYNGNPGTIGLWIDALAVAAGARVLHVGAGLGYYTAVLAHCVGPSGRVVALEVDEALAKEATSNLAAFGWVDVRHGDATQPFDERFDAILINAGVTHPHPAWLDALALDGRMVLPLTCSMDAKGTISKGVVFVLSRTGDGPALEARMLAMVAIYSAVGIRDSALDQRLGKAMMGATFTKVRRLRRDPHDEERSCWFHGDGFCLSMD